MSLPDYRGIFVIATEPKTGFSKNGQSYLLLDLVANDRRKNEQTGQWETVKEIAWWNSSTFSESILSREWQKGDRVYIEGVISDHKYTVEGTQRTDKRLTVYRMEKIAKAQYKNTTGDTAPQNGGYANANNGGGYQNANSPWEDSNPSGVSFDAAPF